MPGYGQIDRDYGIRLATTAPEDDGPVWMVNLMRYKERAEYADGRETTLTGREADDEYMPIGPLTAMGAEIVFVADVEDQFIGDEPTWDRIAIVRYPTRASFLAMHGSPPKAPSSVTVDLGIRSGSTPSRAVAPSWRSHSTPTGVRLTPSTETAPSPILTHSASAPPSTISPDP